MMVNILSHIVEFRNGESGQHVRHIHMMTEILLQHLQKRITKYQITQEDIVRIATASALHDIGKISIPDTILNKPGKLTKEEYEIVKTHSMAGAQMLDALPEYKDTPFVKTAYEICRWHHERYDGKGYPDGLKGEEIPISAQIVSVAGFFRNYPFLCFPTYLSFASNKRFLQRPYIVRFIIFNRLFVPSTKPLL